MKLGYDEILSLYERMKASEPRVQEEARGEIRRTRILVWGTIAGVVLGAAALVVAILAYAVALH